MKYKVRGLTNQKLEEAQARRKRLSLTQLPWHNTKGSKLQKVCLTVLTGYLFITPFYLFIYLFIEIVFIHLADQFYPKREYDTAHIFISTSTGTHDLGYASTLLAPS